MSLRSVNLDKRYRLAAKEPLNLVAPFISAVRGWPTLRTRLVSVSQLCFLLFSPCPRNVPVFQRTKLYAGTYLPVALKTRFFDLAMDSARWSEAVRMQPGADTENEDDGLGLSCILVGLSVMYAVGRCDGAIRWSGSNKFKGTEPKHVVIVNIAERGRIWDHRIAVVPRSVPTYNPCSAPNPNLYYHCTGVAN